MLNLKDRENFIKQTAEDYDVQVDIASRFYQLYLGDNSLCFYQMIEDYLVENRLGQHLLPMEEK